MRIKNEKYAIFAGQIKIAIREANYSTYNVNYVTLIPTTSKLSQPKSQNVTDKIRYKRKVAKCYHDRKAMELPELGSMHCPASEPP